MQDIAQIVFGSLTFSFERDDAFEILVVVREKHIAGLIADLLDFAEAKLSRVATLRYSFEIVKNVPTRGCPVFIGKVVSAHNHVHPEPLSFADVQHEAADRVRAEKRRLSNQIVGDGFYRGSELSTDFLHAAEV